MKKFAGLFLVVCFLVSCQQQKTAYVDNEVLIKNFDALKDSNKKFEKKLKKLQSIWQKDGQRFQQKVKEFQQEARSMSRSKMETQRNALLKTQKGLQKRHQMQRSILLTQRKEAQDSLEALLKEKIAAYAEAHNYAYVFGANPSNNIWYAAESENITQEVIDELNGGSSEKETAEKKNDTPVKRDSAAVNKDVKTPKTDSTTAQ